MLKKFLAQVRSQWMGALALFLVLTTGSAYALAGSNTVFSDDIVNGQVKTQDVATDAVRAPEIAGDSVNTRELVNGGVKSIDLRDNGTWSEDVRDDTLPNGGLSAADLQANSVGSSEVAGGAISSQQVADGSLLGDDIVESSLSTVPSSTLGGYGFYSTVEGAPTGCDPQTQNFVDCGFSRMDLPQATRVLLIATVRSSTASGGGNGFCRFVTNKGGSVFSSATFISGSENTTLVAIVRTGTARIEDYGVECNEQSGDIGYSNTRVVPLAISPL